MVAEHLSGALVRLRDALREVVLPLSVPGAAEQRQEAEQIVAQLDNYVVPRLAHLDAPLLAVVGGSTGAGKSTLVNSLLGRVVSPAGVIRPTTRSPVLVHNSGDARWFESDRILPGLARTRAVSSGPGALQLTADPNLPAGLALLDAPDIDSLVDENRALAAQLLDAADLWLFVTSAARYADAVPWEYLNAAASRGASVAVVCDRIPPAAAQLVPVDLGRLMSARGLADSPLFAVPETVTDEHGRLPETALAPIRSYLATLAADNRRREQVVLATLDGAIGAIVRAAPSVADAARAQTEVVRQLAVDAAHCFHEAIHAVRRQSGDGTLLRGEVLLRWHDYVGTSEFSRVIDEKVSWLRDRITRALTGESPQGVHAAAAAESGLEALVREQGEAACERAAAAWRGTPAGRALMAGHPGLARASDEFATRCASAIRQWQADVLALVADQGKGRRRTARLAAAGVNGAGAALMIVIFAHTAGLSGAEMGVAGGTTVVAQRLLEAIFGDEAVRRLAETARQKLDERVVALMDTELDRFTVLLAELGVDDTVAERVDAAIAEVVAVRSGSPRPGSLAGSGGGFAPADEPSGADVRPAPRLDQVSARAQAGEIVDAELVDEPPALPRPSGDESGEDGRQR
ncbi:Dynamin family protein [Propionibacterium cyclohexanicum]|uniref:Dynamin family protein n=1 Tax=Propionibacterium cyclohexanicum TaxID=64702 RepID=A0A1H9TM63_9ACTN|nr:ABC transporter [Propionibacterium cyclohexanicum]SER98236.1 Dynamin family protein [Propionibacterium cyclohexanicum]